MGQRRHQQQPAERHILIRKNMKNRISAAKHNIEQQSEFSVFH
jgi:hypothetical protein